MPTGWDLKFRLLHGQRGKGLEKRGAGGLRSGRLGYKDKVFLREESEVSACHL